MVKFNCLRFFYRHDCYYYVDRRRIKFIFYAQKKKKSEIEKIRTKECCIPFDLISVAMVGAAMRARLIDIG